MSNNGQSVEENGFEASDREPSAFFASPVPIGTGGKHSKGHKTSFSSSAFKLLDCNPGGVFLVSTDGYHALRVAAFLVFLVLALSKPRLKTSSMVSTGTNFTFFFISSGTSSKSLRLCLGINTVLMPAR